MGSEGNYFQTCIGGSGEMGVFTRPLERGSRSLGVTVADCFCGRGYKICLCWKTTGVDVLPRAFKSGATMRAMPGEGKGSGWQGHALGPNCQPNPGILRCRHLIGSSQHPTACARLVVIADSPAKTMESRAKMFTNVAVEKGLTGPVFQLMLILGLASIQYGYNLWLCYTETNLIKEFYNLTYHSMQRQISHEEKIRENMLLSFAISLFPIGAIIGTLVFGILVDKFGRKGTFMINSYFSLMFSMLMVCANVLHDFMFAMFSRLLIGISMGIFSNVVPMYLIEISPMKLRGAIGMVSHLFLVIGVQLAQIFAFPEMMGTVEGWPILVSFTGILAIFQILLLPPFPESPRYLLIQKNKEEEARQGLKELRLRSDVEDELEELRQEDSAERAEKNMNSLQLLGYRELRWHVVSVIVAVAGQQLSGVNAIYAYAKRLSSATSLSLFNFRYVEIITNVLLIVAISFAMYIVDTKGRKVLLLLGFGMSSVLCILLTVTMDLQSLWPGFCKTEGDQFYSLQVQFDWLVYLNSVFINIFLIMHAMGPSALVNVLIGELFLQSSRSSAYVIGGFSHWFLNYLSVLIFVHIETYVGPYSLLLCSPMSIASFLYIWKMIPETKEKTFLEIQGQVPLYRAKQNVAQEQLRE
ncbi:solute carrier family 2, facilitated glucose transporter member 5-like [Candoia aspera]|uniref:solute carrier family 2, facilitated glucose transporter member 5-like n=1 Tax=Candoia aspera TaxID=51853 RepID=UPI002FD7CBD3